MNDEICDELNRTQGRKRLTGGELDALRKELKQLDEVSEDLLAQICFLQDEYDKVNGKKGKIRKAIETLEGVE